MSRKWPVPVKIEHPRCATLRSMFDTRSANTADELRLRLQGGVYEPGHESYEDTCTLFNTMIERRPRLVVACATVDDVVAALAYARDHDLPIAVRAGGHSVAGLSLCDDGVVLDIRGLADIDVDPGKRTVRVGGGAIWADVDRATQVHGLATTGGRVSTTGVAGLALGGGSGWLERKHGLACDNIVAAELVTWDGRIVNATEEENPDLLWALRGGGGSFGVVTALELELHPLGPEVWGGLALFGSERAHEVIRAFRDVMNGAPDKLSLACALITAPDDDDDVPAALRGQPAVAILGIWAGSVDEGERALAPIRALGPNADYFGPTPYADFQCSVDDPPGYRNYWTAENVVDLPDEAIDAIVRRAAEMPAGPSQLFIVAWGGAVRGYGPAHSPLAGREARFIVHPLMLWDDPADDERCRAVARGFRSDMEPWSTGATYPNFLGDEGSARMSAAYGSSTERLAAVKAEWDPHGVFHTHQALRTIAGAAPAASAAVAPAASGAVRLPVIEQGDEDGLPVVFLHGLSDSARSFEPLLAQLPPSIRAIAVTQRGHGDAPKPEGGYTFEQMAADVVGVLDAMGIDRAVIAGHSMGSIVAKRIAIDAPDRVAGLVLMGARPSFTDPVLEAEFFSLLDTFEDPIDPGFVREFQESTLAQPVPEEYLETVVAESLKLPARVWRALSSSLRQDSAAGLEKIAAPTLVAWGARDEFALREHQDALVDAIPGARLLEYRVGGHAFHWEDPPAFASDLLAFVDENVTAIARGV
jgi:FAD/FMN-containing dehydrogenase/pimeloyl-ACP methyl ester carboxylesterase